MFDQRSKRDRFIFIGFLCLGVFLRFFVMTFGHNFDFDSYCIVGEIAGNFRSVYAETDRYNYAPLFFILQGLLYRISQIDPANRVLIFRILIVSVLTAADLAIALFIAGNYSYTQSIVFFLNPVSIIISGYHNQFDNIAVLFALLSIAFFNEEDRLNKSDVGFILLFSLSLITKHILFLLPVFILLMERVCIKKKALYSFIPPVVFLLSFVPFALLDNATLRGIINNVFRYRSSNNAPLYSIIFAFIDFPGHRIIVYGLMMTVVAWIVRRCRFEVILLVYLITMVCFSSAIVNQYLAIPMAALCILNVGKWSWIYMTAAGLYLLLDESGLGLLRIIDGYYPDSIFSVVGDFYVSVGLILAAWILLFAFIHLILINRKGEELIISCRQ